MIGSIKLDVGLVHRTPGIELLNLAYRERSNLIIEFIYSGLMRTKQCYFLARLSGPSHPAARLAVAFIKLLWSNLFHVFNFTRQSKHKLSQ